VVVTVVVVIGLKFAGYCSCAWCAGTNSRREYVGQLIIAIKIYYVSASQGVPLVVVLIMATGSPRYSKEFLLEYVTVTPPGTGSPDTGQCK